MSDYSDDEEPLVQQRASKRSSARASKGRSMKRAQSSTAMWLMKTGPFLLKIELYVSKFIDFATPLVDKGYEAYDQFYEMLRPYGPDQIIKMLTGLAMMFFGGFFITTVAVAEAMDQGGREGFKKNLKILAQQARQVREANERDDQLDEDGDGIADVDQISAGELSARKMMVFIRSCDPNVVSDALGHLYAILMAVTATLQVKFARAISLGAAIGNVLYKTFKKFIEPPLKEIIPDEDIWKWVPPISQYLMRLIGISIAFSVQRILSTIHTAIRGARLATDGFTEWCEARNLDYLSDGYLDDIAAFALAAMGVWGQLFVWSSLPLPVKLLLFPFTFTEWLLSFLVSVQVSRGTATTGQQAAFQKGV